MLKDICLRMWTKFNDSGFLPLPGCPQYNNDPSVSLKDGEFLLLPIGCHVIKDDCCMESLIFFELRGRLYEYI
jgi:hypothetical protein